MATKNPWIIDAGKIGKIGDGVVIDATKIPKVIKLLPPDLDKFLSAHSDVSDFIVWERPDTALALSGPAKWKDWNTGEKQLLKNAFSKAWLGQLSTDPAPYPNLIDPVTDDHPTTVLHKDVALQHFMESVAVSLVSHFQLPDAFSLLKLAPAQRSFILDSRSIFEWSTGFGKPGYWIHPWVLPARPGYMRQALDTLKILRTSGHKDTIVEMLRFCGNFCHFAGSQCTASYEAFWHYRGYMPVSRTVEGTIPTPTADYPIQDKAAKHWTAGCSGTSGFMAHMLRMVNLPAEISYVCDHALPHFSSIGYWLSHGDDPYKLYYHPDIDPAQLLVDATTFNAWFGPSAADPCSNIGRRAKELFA